MIELLFGLIPGIGIGFALGLAAFSWRLDRENREMEAALRDDLYPPRTDKKRNR